MPLPADGARGDGAGGGGGAGSDGAGDGDGGGGGGVYRGYSGVAFISSAAGSRRSVGAKGILKAP